jgi:hypothetical protein
MKKLFIFSLIWFCAFMMVACQRDEGVQAGYEQGSETYQPRPAGSATATSPQSRSQEIRGELIRVDAERRTFSIRVETGMEQTFKFDDVTTVMGLDAVPGRPPTAAESNRAPRVRDLAGKEGSEVTIQWREDTGEAKMATQVTVTQLKANKPARRAVKKK